MTDYIKNILWAGKAKNAGNKEQQEMLSLFHRPEMEYEVKDELVKELDEWNITEESLSNMNRLFTGIWNTIEKQKQEQIIRRRYLNMSVKLAAALVVGLFLGIFINSLFSRQEPVYYTAHSPEGSVSHWTLPDGTLIYLNSGSEIRYSANGKNSPREVFLSGEAWFSVGTNKKRSFLVHTSLYDVEVTGTRFNIKAYKEENRVTTTLEEGEVIVHSENSKWPEGGIVIKPGQQLELAENEDAPEIRHVNTSWYTAWKDNKLILVNMPLKELLVLLERKYGVEFSVKDETVLNYHCDGTFHGETIIELMDILRKMIPIDYRIVGQTIEITADSTRKRGGTMK